eukprot:TRINITY_DN1330_c0_g1_i1.p1 TRINITY_DN1330_c0_g1~~TRINITY_DN1330_c0_g1_i1.p1  ORF type:complete len:281 (+),score=74.38 TRINITY_DN1330_c0_g1_i1:125-844(+)
MQKFLTLFFLLSFVGLSSAQLNTCLISNLFNDTWTTSSSGFGLVVAGTELVAVQLDSNATSFYISPSNPRFKGDISGFAGGVVNINYALPQPANPSGLILRSAAAGVEVFYPLPAGASFQIPLNGLGWSIRAVGAADAGTPTTADAVAYVLGQLSCVLISGPKSNALSGFSICEHPTNFKVDCQLSCSGNGQCIPGPSFTGPTCKCNFGFSGVMCATKMRSIQGRFAIPPRVSSWQPVF